MMAIDWDGIKEENGLEGCDEVVSADFVSGQRASPYMEGRVCSKSEAGQLSNGNWRLLEGYGPY